MGTLVTRLIDEAGFAEVAARALRGALTPDDLQRLREADTLVLSAIADRVRAEHHGDSVKLLATRGAPTADLNAVVATCSAGANADQAAPTGEEILRSIALCRLQTPPSRSIAVSWDDVGLQLAQTALIFGANVLFGGVGNQGVLPLADGPGVRKQEITGLVQRALRKPQWVEAPVVLLESRS